MKTRWAWTAAALTLILAPAGNADDPAIKWVDGLSAAMEKAKADKKPALVVISSSKVRAAGQLMSRVLADDAVVKAAEKFVAVKVNAETNKQDIEKHKLDAPLGVVLVAPSGEVLARKFMVADPAKFADWLDGIDSSRKQLADELAKLKSNPKDLEVLKRAGVLQGVLGDYAAAKKLLDDAEKAVAADDFAQLANDVADGFQEELNLIQAISIFRRAEKNPKPKLKGYALGSIATCYMQAGMFPQAKKEFEATLKIEGIAEDVKQNCEQSLERVNQALERAKEAGKDG